MEQQSQHDQERNWEQMGAASGLLATLLFVVAFIVFLTTDPMGTPPLPSVENAQEAPAFLAANLSAYRIELLLRSLGIVSFLWFVGTLWVNLKGAEGDPGRGSTLAVIGASVGAGLMLVGLVAGFTSGLSTSPSQASTVPTMYTAGALLFAFGGGALALFFFGVAKVILQTNAMAKWLGVLAFIAALLCVPAYSSPFFGAGPLNAATGALGLWTWYAAFVAWVFLASLMLTLKERRLVKERRLANNEAEAHPPTVSPMADTEGAL
jgi:hypothetical protein